jgi:hypothetical protein
MKLLAINNRCLKLIRLNETVPATKSGDARITLFLEDDDYFHTAVLHYDGGPQYLRLERIAESPDRQSDITKTGVLACNPGRQPLTFHPDRAYSMIMLVELVSGYLAVFQ